MKAAILIAIPLMKQNIIVVCTIFKPEPDKVVLIITNIIIIIFCN